MLYSKGMLGLKVCLGFWVNEATSLGSPGVISRYLVILRKSSRRKTLSWCSKLLTQNRLWRWGCSIGEFRFNRTIRSEKYRMSDVRDPMSDEHLPNFGKNLSDLGRSPTRFWPNVLSYPIIKNRVYRRALQIVQWKGILEELFSVSAVVVDPWCWCWLVWFVQRRMRRFLDSWKCVGDVVSWWHLLFSSTFRSMRT